jgi:cell shape-determining protein MreD
MGVSLFGVNAFVLTFAGYAAGKLRRRVASERAAGQLVIAVVATLYYWLSNSFLCSMFDEAKGTLPYFNIALEVLLNVIFVSGVFWITDQWIDFWRLEREHM